MLSKLPGLKSRVPYICFMLLTIASLGVSLFPNRADAANGADFRPGRIIDDSTFTNSNSMSAAAIQEFLNSRVPNCQAGYTCLKSFSEHGKSAAQIIFEQSQAFGINPQAMIVLLQKEQALVTDTSPGSYEYRFATGFCVYDVSPPPQCAGTDGFTNQIYYAARMFRKIMNGDPSQYVSFMLGNNNIRYHPTNDACGAPNVFIENRATQALYTYTPYQPNAAALANLYGLGDGCSAYGNRNFWRLFTDWFGPPTGEGFSLMTSYNNNGDARQWVVSKGTRRLVPNVEVLKAWGLDTVPLSQVSGTYLGSFPEIAPLTRLMRPSGTLDVYFVDGKNCYRLPAAETFGAWGFNPAAISDVAVDLARLPVNRGNLSYAVRNASQGGSGPVYMVDGGSIRQYQSPDILSAWEGDNPNVTALSNDYISLMGSGGSAIGSAKATAGGDGAIEYQVVAGQKLAQSFTIAQLYPGVAQTVTGATINRLVPSVPANQFIRASNSPTVYMIDGGTKHAVASPDVLRAWGIGPSPAVNLVTQGNINLIPTGTALNTYEADVGGQLYLMDGRKISVPANLDSTYRTGTVYSASTALISLSPNGGTATNFLKGSQTAPIYLMDEGTRRHIRTPSDLSLWSNGGPVTIVSDYVLSQFTGNGLIGSFVSDGTNEYVMEGGTKRSVSTGVKNNWQLSDPTVLSTASLGRFSTGAALGNKLQNQGRFVFIQGGSAYITVDPNIAGMWGINDAPSEDMSLVDAFLSKRMLTRVASSKTQGDNRLFVVDRGVLYWLTPVHAANLGISGPSTAIDPDAMTVNNWESAVVRDEGGSAYVIDGGAKRPLPAGVIRDQWTKGDYSGVPTMTNGFLNALPTGIPMERAIKGSGVKIYSADDFKKRWIQSPSTYHSAYAPYTNVSDYLVSILPDGTPIP